MKHSLSLYFIYYCIIFHIKNCTTVCVCERQTEREREREREREKERERENEAHRAEVKAL